MTDVADIMDYWTDDEKREAAQLMKAKVFWPEPKQQMVIDNEADIIGFGGAAGGGKSYLGAGLTTLHKRSAIIRPQKNQTRKFVEEIGKMLGSRDGYSSQTSTFRFVTEGVDRVVSFFGLDAPGDEEKQQGDDYDLKCVGAGTLVWMADGSRKAVERIAVGDQVQTLEGPRVVTRTIRQTKRAVRITTASGSQVQGSTHQTLGPFGWRSAEDVEDHQRATDHAISFATPNRGERKSAGSLWLTSLVRALTRDGQPTGRPQLHECVQGHEGCRCMSATGADAACTDQGSDDGSRCDQRQGCEPHPSPTLQRQALPSIQPRRSECEAYPQARHSDVLDAPQLSSLRDLQDRCLTAHCLDGEPPHPCAGGDRRDQRQPIGVGLRTPIYLLEDGGQRTRTHSRRKWSYAHPYTKETRTTDSRVRVEVADYCDAGICALYDLTVEGANHYITQQGFVNRNCYDEVTQMREDDIRYTLTWNRTDDPDQRVRAVLTMNPPTTVEGRWVIKFFAPWLDKAHPNPAKDGELRWFATVGDNKDYELGGPQPFIIKWIAGKATPWYNFSPADYSKEDIITPKSRTFIHSYVTDNSYYMKTGYIAQLQLLPEPLRSQMLKGDFMAGVVDNAHQIIPTKWVEAAQLRYRQRRALFEAGAAQRGPLDSIGVDAARGGNMGGAEVSEGTDEMVISKRYGTFFDALQINKGIDINTGAKAAALVIAERMDDAPVHVDVVGVGTSVYDSLNENNIHTIAVNGATSAHGLAKAGNLRFANRRAELHWRLREALDPVHGDDIAIPDDPQLLGDLAAPTWELKAQGITVEGKDAIKKRLGRSPDRGEALMLALMATPKRQMVLGPLLAALAHNSGESYEVRRLRELEGR